MSKFRKNISTKFVLRSTDKCGKVNLILFTKNNVQPPYLPPLMETKQKYSSVRKVRSLVHTNIHNASAKSAFSTLVWRSEKGRFVTTTASSDREWHVRFMSGLHARIGDKRRKRDAAISIEQMILLEHLLEVEWREAVEDQDKGAHHWIAETACFFLIGYCGSLKNFLRPSLPI